MGTIKVDTVTGLADPNKATIPNTITMGSTTATLNFGNTTIANASAGSTTITGEGGTNTTNLQQGLTKSWTNYNGVANSIRDSFNVSSVTDVATGKYGIVMSTAMANILYCPTVYSNSTNGDSFYGGGRAGVKNTEFVSDSTTQYEVVSYSNDYIDATRNYTAVDGDLG